LSGNTDVRQVDAPMVASTRTDPKPRCSDVSSMSSATSNGSVTKYHAAGPSWRHSSAVNEYPTPGIVAERSTVVDVPLATGELDFSDEAVAERIRRSNSRVFAVYLVVQAVVGVAFWVGLAVSDDVRELFELVPEIPAVTTAWLLADLVVGVAGSAAGAYALWTDARWALPVIAFTTGGIVYPTVMLVSWVLMEDTGLGTLVIMVPPSAISLYVTWWTWRSRR
jgi:hypothetical protein